MFYQNSIPLSLTYASPQFRWAFLTFFLQFPSFLERLQVFLARFTYPPPSPSTMLDHVGMTQCGSQRNPPSWKSYYFGFLVSHNRYQDYDQHALGRWRITSPGNRWRHLIFVQRWTWPTTVLNPSIFNLCCPVIDNDEPVKIHKVVHEFYVYFWSLRCMKFLRPPYVWRIRNDLSPVEWTLHWHVSFLLSCNS